MTALKRSNRNNPPLTKHIDEKMRSVTLIVWISNMYTAASGHIEFITMTYMCQTEFVLLELSFSKVLLYITNEVSMTRGTKEILVS